MRDASPEKPEAAGDPLRKLIIHLTLPRMRPGTWPLRGPSRAASGGKPKCVEPVESSRRRSQVFTPRHVAKMAGAMAGAALDSKGSKAAVRSTHRGQCRDSRSLSSTPTKNIRPLPPAQMPNRKARHGCLPSAQCRWPGSLRGWRCHSELRDSW